MQHIQISNLENSHWSWQKCVRSNWGHKPKRVGNHSFIHTVESMLYINYHFCHTGQRSSNEYCILFIGDALVVVSSFPRLQHCSKIFEQQMFCWLLCLWILCVRGLVYKPDLVHLPLTYMWNKQNVINETSESQQRLKELGQNLFCFYEGGDIL